MEIHRGSYMSAHVLFNFNNTGASYGIKINFEITFLE